MAHTMSFKIALMIKEINLKVNAKITEELKSTGLTVPQITLIKLLAHYNKLTVSELSRQMSLSTATVSGILDRLEKMDIIERERSTEDKRIVHIVFSQKGIKLSEEIKNKMNNSFEHVFDGANEEELEEVYKGLKVLLNIVDNNLQED